MVIRRDMPNTDMRRSRKGAWIEIDVITLCLTNGLGRSRKGAWIEIRANGEPLPNTGSLP